MELKVNIAEVPGDLLADLFRNPLHGVERMQVLQRLLEGSYLCRIHYMELKATLGSSPSLLESTGRIHYMELKVYFVITITFQVYIESITWS